MYFSWNTVNSNQVWKSKMKEQFPLAFKHDGEVRTRVLKTEKQEPAHWSSSGCSRLKTTNWIGQLPTTRLPQTLSESVQQDTIGVISLLTICLCTPSHQRKHINQHLYTSELHRKDSQAATQLTLIRFDSTFCKTTFIEVKLWAASSNFNLLFFFFKYLRFAV